MTSVEMFVPQKEWHAPTGDNGGNREASGEGAAPLKDAKGVGETNILGSPQDVAPEVNAAKENSEGELINKEGQSAASPDLPSTSTVAWSASYAIAEAGGH